MAAGRLAFAGILTVAFTMAAAPAFAGSAYWHGTRSGNWGDGIRSQSGESNWYSTPPPNGSPEPVPDGTATFAAGADHVTVTIDRPTIVRTLVFEKVPQRYRIIVDNPLTVIGKGVVTERSRPPLFEISSAMTLIGRADGGNAVYRIAKTGRLDMGVGSEAGRLVGLGKVVNSGRLVGGLSSLIIQDLEQRPEGLLRIAVSTVGHPVIQASRLAIAGDIVVEGSKDVGPGDYLVITYGQRNGKFRREFFEGFNARLEAKLVYKIGYIFVRLREK